MVLFLFFSSQYIRCLLLALNNVHGKIACVVLIRPPNTICSAKKNIIHASLVQFDTYIQCFFFLMYRAKCGRTSEGEFGDLCELNFI